MSKRAPQFERQPRGSYPTPWAAFEPLVPHLPTHSVELSDPCAGDGALCYHFAKAGYNVGWASDIEPRHPNVVKLDVHDIASLGAEFPLFVTNPPWPEPHRNGEPTLSIAKKLVSLAPTWLLLPSDFMHNVYAAELMGQCSRIVSVGRVKWIPDSPHDAGFDNCAWYEFMPFTNGGVLSFVPRQPKRRAA